MDHRRVAGGCGTTGSEKSLLGEHDLRASLRGSQRGPSACWSAAEHQNIRNARVRGRPLRILRPNSCHDCPKLKGFSLQSRSASTIIYGRMTLSKTE
jgi:hypothetical protein